MSNILQDALKVLRRDGWTKGILRNEDNKVCALGAINTARDGNALRYSRYEEPEIGVLTSVIRENYPDRLGGGYPPMLEAYAIANFNNHPDTTFEDIEKMFEKAAVKLEEKI